MKLQEDCRPGSPLLMQEHAARAHLRPTLGPRKDELVESSGLIVCSSSRPCRGGQASDRCLVVAGEAAPSSQACVLGTLGLPGSNLDLRPHLALCRFPVDLLRAFICLSC